MKEKMENYKKKYVAHMMKKGISEKLAIYDCEANIDNSDIDELDFDRPEFDAEESLSYWGD